MEKSKFLKPFSFASLALLMGAAGVFAFAPLGASPSVAKANEIETTTTETGGLIVPKNDDPVIYTTESGLEIKYGNAVPTTINSSLGSGNLAGFPYFTTKNGSTTYTWVIIGRNSNVTTLSLAVQSYLFSTWKTNNSSSNDWKYGNSFFKNTYETSTPAGSAINNVVPSKSYVNDNISFSINDITTNDNEIPSGCVLALSNTSVGTSAYYSGAEQCTSAAHTFAGANNTLRTTCANYYTNDTFGFGTLKSSLQNITLKQICFYTSSNTKTTATTNLYFFPLDAARNLSDSTTGGSGKSHFTAALYEEYLSYCNFKYNTYLTLDQWKLANYVQSRSMATYWQPFKTYANGLIDETPQRNSNIADIVRPACVIKVT